MLRGGGDDSSVANAKEEVEGGGGGGVRRRIRQRRRFGKGLHGSKKVYDYDGSEGSGSGKLSSLGRM